ncbi:MAG: cytochrome c3 family protein [Candidatus Deferrimicrobium sp.]
MKIRGVRIPAGVLAALAGVLCCAPALVASDGPRRGNPHAHFPNPGQCPRCHLTPGSQPGPGRFSTETDAVCLGCHTKEGIGRSHPVNVRPDEKHRKMEVPADLRLDVDGRLMCLTCHTAHGPYVSYFLRRSSPDGGFDVLCESCHGKQ